MPLQDVSRALQDGLGRAKTATSRPKSHPRADFGGFLKAKFIQVGTRYASQSHLMFKQAESKKILFSYYNLTNFVSSVEHFFGQNSYKICFKCIFLKACSKNASKMHKICYMRLPRGSQDASRTAQDGFCFRFGRQLGAKLEPCWPLFPPKTLPRRLQDDPRCPQKSFGSPKTAQEASKPALEPSRPQF